ncbi:MAG: hypothetical protein JW997_00335 [Actinobacteria bacterium]|nr:hypothetical protein [Actinomycetota bacterium]
MAFFDLNKYRQNAESFLSELDKEYYMHYAGLQQELNTSDIYIKYESLFDLSNFEAIKEMRKASKNADETKKLSYLIRFCGEGLVENYARELVDRIGEQEANATVKIDGKDISYRYSDVLLANEADKSKRDAIDDKRNAVTKKSLNPSLYQYWETVHRQAEKLGFASYRDMFEFLKQEDFSTLENSMNMLLEKTADIYQVHFGNLLKKELGISLGDARRSDFAYLRRAARYDRYFKKEALVNVFKDTLLEMGIDIEKQPNIILDVEERRNKSPRAFCATVKVPDEIYLVVMPKGGQDDFEAMFHEGGHAEHFANTSAKLDFEYKFLGDNAVTEGYAFTLEHLMQSSAWLSCFLKMAHREAEDFTYFSNLSKLWFCRRYASKLKYELLLHNGSSISGKDQAYRHILSDAVMMQHHPEDYLKDVDEGFYCTNYIRAWIFEAQLKDYMHRKFGYEWFRQKKAGSFLKEIWSYGQKYGPDEVLMQLDYKGLDINYLIDNLAEEIQKHK